MKNNINTTAHFDLNHYIKVLMSKMEFDKATPEMRQEMYDIMERQILYRLMTALSLNLDVEAAATFAIEAQKPENRIVDVVNKILEENDTAYDAVMSELEQFQKETLETFHKFQNKN